MDFIPFDATEEEVAARQVLRPGVPNAMRAPLVTWIWNNLDSGYGNVPMETLHNIENILDISFGVGRTSVGAVHESSFRQIMDKVEPRGLLRIADLLLYAKGEPRRLDALRVLLRSGRSQYEVVRRDATYRLSPRLPEGVQAAAENLISESETAGVLLNKAWSKMYDIEPDPTGAYAAAVKAVEAAALPALGIAKATATISDAVRAIEAKDATWRLPFKREHTQHPSRDVLLGMLRSLYRGQRDRHGSDAYSDVTSDEAEAAVLMSVTLVGLFARGLVQERDTDSFA